MTRLDKTLVAVWVALAVALWLVIVLGGCGNPCDTRRGHPPVHHEENR
jgi:hypothetical protein